MKQMWKIFPIYTYRKQDKKWSGQHKHEEHEVFGPAFPRMMTLQIISFRLEVRHNIKHTSRRKYTFSDRCRSILANLGCFALFGVLLQAYIMQWSTKIDKYVACTQNKRKRNCLWSSIISLCETSTGVKFFCPDPFFLLS